MEIDKIYYVDDVSPQEIEAGIHGSIAVRHPQDIVKLPFDQIDGLIILCETGTDAKGRPIERKRFAGIRFAQYLRVSGLVCPIVFVSAMPASNLLKRRTINCNIIHAIGHAYEDFFATPECWVDRLKAMKPLGELELYDVQHNYCNKIGQAEMDLHALRSETTNLSELHKKLCDCLEKIFGLFEKSASGVINDFLAEHPSLTEDSKDIAIEFVKRACRDLMSDFAGEGSKMHQPSTTSKGWKVLYLDDEITADHPFVAALEERGVKVIMASSVDEALTIWEKSNIYQPEIMVVISDYRLEEVRNGVKVHQQKQGYTFLREISRSGQLVKLIALSAMPRRFLFESFKYYGIQCHIYSKEDFRIDQHEHRNFLSEEIIRLGEDNWYAVNSLPGTPGWKDLEPAYVYYRESLGYLLDERRLNHIVGLCLDDPERSAEILAKYNFKAKTGRYDFNPEKLEDSRNRFIERYILRRLSIGLYLAHNYDLDRIYGTLKPGSSPSKIASNRFQFFNKLGLRLSEFPFGLTDEEINWLRFDLKYTDIRPRLTTYLEVIQKAKTRLQHFLLQEPGVALSVFGEEQKLQVKYNNEDIALYLSSDKVPVVRDFTELRIVIDALNRRIIANPEDRFRLISSFHQLRLELLNLVKPYRQTDLYFKGFYSFVYTLKNQDGLRRDKEYEHLLEPWRLTRYSKAKDVIDTIIEHLLAGQPVQTEGWEQENLYQSLIKRYDKLKQIDVTDLLLLNPILVEVAQEFNYNRAQFYDNKFSTIVLEDRIHHQTPEKDVSAMEGIDFEPVIRFSGEAERWRDLIKHNAEKKIINLIQRHGIVAENEVIQCLTTTDFQKNIQLQGIEDKLLVPSTISRFSVVAYMGADLYYQFLEEQHLIDLSTAVPIRYAEEESILPGGFWLF